MDSIPTSAGFEDFVSMGPTAALKAMQILENTEYIVSVEFLCGAQAVEFRGSMKLGKGTKTVYSIIRKIVPMLNEDRVLSEDIERVRQAIRNGSVLAGFEKSSET